MSSGKFWSAVNLNKQTNFGFQGQCQVTDHMISAKSSLSSLERLKFYLAQPQIFENFAPKILAHTTTRGKNFGCMFLDVSCHPEFESAIRMVKFLVNHEISDLLCLSVHDLGLRKK